jgi:hypothetical protein
VPIQNVNWQVRILFVEFRVRTKSGKFQFIFAFVNLIYEKPVSFQMQFTVFLQATCEFMVSIFGGKSLFVKEPSHNLR